MFIQNIIEHHGLFYLLFLCGLILIAVIFFCLERLIKDDEEVDVEVELQKWKEEELAEKRKQEAEAERFLRSWLTDFISEGELVTFTFDKNVWAEHYQVCYEVQIHDHTDIRYTTISPEEVALWKKQKRLREELETKKRSGIH